MSHTLLAVFGAMVMDGNFRRTLTGKGIDSARATTGDRQAVLRERGFFLTCGEREVVDRMIASFQSGRVDDACALFARECPEWPCSDFRFD